MPVTLEQIVAKRREEVALQKAAADLAALRRQAEAHQPRGFRQALETVARARPAVIAELKKASPSKGVLRGSFPAGRLATALANGGAAALSVLTEERHFHGSLDNLREASAATELPCLRKDFIVDEYQLYQARLNDADAVLLIASALAWVVAGRLLAPLRALDDTARSISETDLARRIPVSGNDEIAELARTFNAMLDRLEGAFASQRAFVSDASHELRTPLAVLQGRLEGMLDGVYPRDEAQINAVLQETHMLTRLVDDLRTLAHTESGTLALQKESTDLAILLNDTAASFAAEATERHVQLDVEAPASLPLVDIDPVRVREVLTNLISNALRHTSENGRVSVSAAAQPDAIVVAVSDKGGPIPAEDLPRIFDRFYKGHGSRGSGLGLTIARNLVVAHGGEMRAESAEGKGTTMTFTLPFVRRT